MAASLAAYYQKVKIGHVEAGLRTFQKYAPFPEEINRKVAGAVTDIHFAPTERAKKNLLLEGVSDSNIHVTGNTVIDAVLLIIKKIETENLQKRIISNLVAAYPNLSSVLKNNCQPDGNRRLILVTGHRRENFGKGFENICQALITIASKHPNVDIIYPVHLNPNVQEPVYRMLGSCNNIYLIDPIEYLPFVYLMYQSELIITDSGGVQEEAPSFGKPVLVTRDITERPEAIDTGTVKLVGTDHRSIVDTVTMLLENTNVYYEMAQSINPYGDGKASERIVGALKF
jgi:UDP-N-acetylglucosamine 2-epimerase (non-hydrolysing)